MGIPPPCLTYRDNAAMVPNMTDNAGGYSGVVSGTTELEQVDLSKHVFAPACDVCGTNKATHVAQGCADAHPVLMCDGCLDRGLEVIALYIRMWQKLNKRVFVCGDCYRPVLTLDTHLDVRRLPE